MRSFEMETAGSKGLARPDAQVKTGRLTYEPAFDGLRGIAILSVIGFHTQVLPGGWAGVDIFFVLSGYLIVSLLAEELSTYGELDFARFYIRRFLRLAPAFALLLAVEFILATLFSPHKQTNYAAIAIAASYLMNWNRAFDWVSPTSLAHTWSLAMEEQFYLLWPVTFLCIWPRKPLRWVLSFVAVIFLWRTFLALNGADPERTYNGFDTHADALLIGCALALAKIDSTYSEFARRFAFVPLIAVAGIFLVLPHRSIFTQTFGLTAAAIFSAWLIVAARQSGWLHGVLSLKPLVYTGRISYGWYLWHHPFLIIGAALVPQDGKIILVGASYLVAMASYHFLETPALKLKARFQPAERQRKSLRGSIPAQVPFAATPAQTSDC